jgi:DNA repair photolyase
MIRQMVQTAANQRHALRVTTAKSILSPVSGFLAEAGFTHSLTPARNCTFGCTYCYVPTMRVYAGLKPEDWTHWGQWSTVKENAAELLVKELRPHQVIYCSPLTDPYQPVEAGARLMPGVLAAVAANPPKTFVIQTRGPLILRDLDLVRRAGARVSFSLTTNRDDVRKVFEPHCAPIAERISTMARLRDAGIPVSAALAPILPCDPEALVAMALVVSDGPIVADPFHVRAVKRSGATTREPAYGICRHFGWEEWLDPGFQGEVLERMAMVAKSGGREFGFGASGFGLLTKALS